MSGPMPSPSMNGRIGSSGTTNWPFLRAIGVPLMGGLSDVKFGMAFRSGHLSAKKVFRELCGKLCGKQIELTRLSRGVSNVLAVCTITGRLEEAASQRAQATDYTKCLRSSNDA